MGNRVGRRTFMKTSVAVSAVAAESGLRATASAGAFPTGKIKGVEISRLICGSNPFYGGAHSRDLIYVGKLLRGYNTEEKIFDTLEICEESGINTMIEGNPAVRYRKARGGRMQALAMIMLDGEAVETGEGLLEDTRKAIDNGVTGAFIRGAEADRWVQSGKARPDRQVSELVGRTG